MYQSVHSLPHCIISAFLGVQNQTSLFWHAIGIILILLERLSYFNARSARALTYTQKFNDDILNLLYTDNIWYNCL